MIYNRHKTLNVNGRTDLFLQTCNKILQKEDTECIPALSEILNTESFKWNVCNVITNRMPDPALIPAIKEAIINDAKNVRPGREFSRDLLKILLLCGDKKGAITTAKELNELDSSLLNLLYDSGEHEYAIQLAIEQIEKPIRTDSSNNYSDDIEFNTGIMLLLGKSGRTNLAPYIESYTDDKFLENLRHVDFDKNAISITRKDYLFNSLQSNAIMALARLTGKDAIPRLRHIYQTNDDFNLKYLAAVCLYYVGDNTGWELIEPLIEDPYFSGSVAESIHGISINTILYEPITRYLQSKRTYALLLKRMKNYFSNDDRYALFNQGASDFLSSNKKEIMHILVNHLNSPYAIERSAAIVCLREITGQNFGFQPKKQFGQEESIRNWKNYIEQEY
jgi:hypothetical protein